MLSTKKILFLFLLSLFISKLHAQEKRMLFSGTIKDNSGTIKDVHVYNMSTKKGSVTNEQGYYEIYAAVGDILKVSSIQHQTILRVIQESDTKHKTIDFILLELINYLDEIVIKKQTLTGFIGIDSKKVPIDTIGEIVSKLNNDIKSLSMDAIMNMGYGKDEVHLRKPTNRTNPTTLFKGVGGGIGFATGEKKKEKINKIVSRTFNSKKIVDTFGRSFFINLKIPETHIYSFIDYCKSFDIEKLFNDNQMLQLLKIFEEKSVSYLQLIK